MKLRFTPRAAQDLADTAAYLNEHNPAAAKRVRSEILDALQGLVLFPEVGRRQRIEDVRKLVTRRYSYLIYYRLDRAADEIAVLAIQHHARSRPFDED